MPPIRRNLFPSYLAMRMRLAVRQWLGISNQTVIIQHVMELQSGLRRDLDQSTSTLSQSVNATSLASGRVQTELYRLEAKLNCSASTATRRRTCCSRSRASRAG
jgi:hypothetical protein